MPTASQLFDIAALFLKGMKYSIDWVADTAVINVNELAIGDQRRLDLLEQALSAAAPIQIACPFWCREDVRQAIAEKTAALNYDECELIFDGDKLTINWPPAMINHHASQIKWAAMYAATYDEDVE